MSINTITQYQILYLNKYDDLKFYYSTIICDGVLFEGTNALRRNIRFEGKLEYSSYIKDNSNISADIGRFTSIVLTHINILQQRIPCSFCKMSK